MEDKRAEVMAIILDMRDEAKRGGKTPDEMGFQISMWRFLHLWDKWFKTKTVNDEIIDIVGYLHERVYQDKVNTIVDKAVEEAHDRIK